MKENNTSTNRQKILAVLGITIFVALSALIIYFVGRPMIALAGRPDEFRAWVDDRGIPGMLAYMGMVILQIIVAVIPGEPLELAAGYAFGTVQGMILCLLAAVIGSMAVFYLVRKFGIRLVEVFFSREKLHSLRFLRETPKRDIIFFIIFAIPGTPKDLLCYFAGITEMRPSVWLFICTVGRIPSVISSVLAGNAVGTESYFTAAVVLGITLAISGIGVLIYRRLCEKHRSGRGKE